MNRNSFRWRRKAAIDIYCRVWDWRGPRYSFATLATIIRDNRRSTGMVYFVSVWLADFSLYGSEINSFQSVLCHTSAFHRDPFYDHCCLSCMLLMLLRFSFLCGWCPALSYRLSRPCITPQLCDNLHWLRVRERITFKLRLFIYNALSHAAR